MPELPEVETVKNTLKKLVLNEKIISVNVLYNNIIAYPKVEEFKKNLINQTILDIKRRGKWLMFELNDYYLLSHLRMEGKYIIRNINDDYDKHEHVEFVFENKSLRYKDTRKFGKMYLYQKENIFDKKPLSELGLEPWDLNIEYLKQKYQNKNLAIKTVLLDQSIIVGIGNIYADEILFLSKINPFKKAKELNIDEINKIIINTKEILEKAIELGGTTIKSYESSEGVHGKFQEELLIHGKTSNCPICNNEVIKTKIGGRGTYYCNKCQK